MKIEAIPRSEFDRLLPYNSALKHVMVEQVEWFSNGSRNTLGTVAEGVGVAGWSYAIFKRDRQDDFHVRKVTCNFFSLEAARVDLLLSMAEIVKIDNVKPMANFRLPSMQAELLALNHAR